MFIYYTIVLFVFGLVLGSFYNVVGYRLPKGESLLFPSSHCPNCNHKIKWYENIPLISYIIQIGKCRGCKKSISIIYPTIEVITGLLFASSYVLFGFSIELFVSLILVSIFIIIIVSDIRYMIIPDELLVIGIVSILILYFFKYNLTEMGFKILDIILSFGIMYSLKLLGDFIFKKESLGGGDIKLMALIGLVVGWELSIITIFIASILALPIASLFLYTKKEHILAFGPFLCIGTLILYFLETDINQIMNLILKIYG